MTNKERPTPARWLRLRPPAALEWPPRYDESVRYYCAEEWEATLRLPRLAQRQEAQRQLRVREQIRTVLHEAGHWRCRYVTVDTDWERGSFGHASVRPGDERQHSPDPERSFRRANCLISYAGVLAEEAFGLVLTRPFFPDDPDDFARMVLAEGDFEPDAQSVYHMAAELTLPASRPSNADESRAWLEQTDRMVNRLARLGEQLVRRHSDAIEKTAAALLEKTRLDSTELDAAIAASRGGGR